MLVRVGRQDDSGEHGHVHGEPENARVSSAMTPSGTIGAQHARVDRGPACYRHELARLDLERDVEHENEDAQLGQLFDRAVQVPGCERAPVEQVRPSVGPSGYADEQLAEHAGLPEPPRRRARQAGGAEDPG